MAIFTQRPKLTVEIVIALTEAEARALEALAGYGADPFLKVFYKSMGRHYLEPHEEGLRSLFKGAKAIDSIIQRKIKAEKVFLGES